MGAFIIIGGVLILAIIVWGLRLIRKLYQEKNKPLSSQAMQFELNAEIKPLQVEETYNQRKKRVMTLMLGGIAAVVVLAAFGGFVSNFVDGQARRAEEQRLRQAAEQEVAKLFEVMPVTVANAYWCSKPALYARFVEYKTQRMVDLLTEQKKLESERMQFEAETSIRGNLEEFSTKAKYDEYQKFYDDTLSEQQSDFDKLRYLSLEEWTLPRSLVYEAIVLVIFVGLCVWSYKNKKDKAFLISCGSVGIAFLFGALYWGLWLHFSILLACCCIFASVGMFTWALFRRRNGFMWLVGSIALLEVSIVGVGHVWTAVLIAILFLLCARFVVWMCEE